MQIPLADRYAWLESNADDALIENNVRKLLVHHHIAEGSEDEYLDTPEPPPCFDSATILAGRFQIVRLIGLGGMGEVYEVTDNHTGDTLAIKALRPELVGDKAFVARFLRELQVSRRIAHPNVCHVLEFYPPGNAPEQCAAFFTMELLLGETLAQRINRKGRFTGAEALPLLRQIAAGLGEVHALRIIHRDLKPANIMLVPDALRGERAVVMDFGLARTDQTSSVNTRSGPFIGTPAYMAPEQFKRRPLTTACDVYAFGVTAFEMVTGRSHPLGYLATAAPDLKPDWDRVLQRCFDAVPENRPASVMDVVTELERAESARADRRSFFGKSWVMMAAVVIFTCVAAVVWMANLRTPARAEVATKLTFENLALDPSASADGKILIYASDRWQRNRRDGVMNIWSQRLDTGEQRPVTTEDANEEQTAISADGKLVAFRSRTLQGIFVVPLAGGVPRLLARWGRNPQFSPDGKLVAYWTGRDADYGAATGRMFVVPVAGGNPRELAADFIDARLPTWSPGGLILFRGARTDQPTFADNVDWWVTDQSGSAPRPLGAFSRARLLGVDPINDLFDWDGKQIIFSARAGSSTNLWRLRLNPAERVTSDPERLTRGGERETSPTLLGDGRLAYSIWHGTAHVWRVSTVTGAAEQVTSGDLIDVKPSVSSSGRFLEFSLRRGSDFDICRADLQMSSSCVNSFPSKVRGFISPGGRTIATLVDQQLSFRAANNGTVHTVPCPGCNEIAGWISDDGVLIRSAVTQRKTAFRMVDIRSGGIRDIVAALGLHDASIAPDKRRWAVSIRNSGEISRIYVRRFPDDGQAMQNAITPDGFWSDSPVWSADGSQVYYSSNRDGFKCVWEQRIDPNTLQPIGPAQELHHFGSGTLTPEMISPDDFAMVRGGNSLFLSVASLSGNIWAMNID